MPIAERLRESLRANALAVENLGLGNVLWLRMQRVRAWLAGLGGRREAFALRSKHAAREVWCRPGTTDSKVFYQIFIFREYSCLDDLREVRTVVDCGANVGYASAYFLSRFPEARLIAVEPDPGNFEMLERNLAPYGARARAVRAAVWARETALKIEDGGQGAWSFQVRECDAGEAGSIPATTVRKLVEEAGEVSVLKMDVEGAETVIFAEDCRDWLGRVENIVIELHGEEGRRVFGAAMEGQPFALTRHGS